MKQITTSFSGYGHFKISTKYRGKSYSTITTNTLAIDRYNDDSVSDRVHLDGGYTRHQAAQTLYNEIKRAHDLR